MLKIVTYNVNGIRQRITQFGSLLKLLDSLDADIICFQEIKVTKQEMTADLIMAEGYESFFASTRTTAKGRTAYSGVATFCRVKSAFSSTEVALPVAAEEGFTSVLENPGGVISRSGKVFEDMEFDEDYQRNELLKIDSEGRCVITDHGHFVLFNVYGPRADPDDAERVQFKAKFYKIMQKRWELLQQEKRRIIVVGDLNIAPSAIDRCDAGPDFDNNEFRVWMRSMLVRTGGSFVDIFREKHPQRKDAYTHWSVHNGAEEFNYGSRIDHILATDICLHDVNGREDHNLVACHVEECDIMTQFRRWKAGISLSRWKGGRATKLEGSDHVPVFVTLKDIPDIQLHSTPSSSARYMPGIRGSQQTIVSVLMKRQVTDTVEFRSMPSPASIKVGSCSAIDASTSKEMVDMASARRGLVVSTHDVQLKKKMKQNKKSQLSLTSFFQKVRTCNELVVNATEDAVDDHEKNLNSEDGSMKLVGNEEELKVVGSEGCEEAKEVSGSGAENEKKTVAVVEWERIKQRMHESIPVCEGHNEACVARVVKKAGPNYGRRFYVCARAEGPSSNPETRCEFFRWAGGLKGKQKK